MDKGCVWDIASAGRLPRQDREPGGNGRDLWPHVLHWVSFGKSLLLKFHIHYLKPRGFGYHLQLPPSTDSASACNQCVEPDAAALRQWQDCLFPAPEMKELKQLHL